MPRIFDNIQSDLLPAITELLPESSRFDACVGYFNLRGWRALSTQIDEWAESERDYPHVRILVGMQGRPEEDVRTMFGRLTEAEKVDNATADRLRTEVAKELREQLSFGIPSQSDEVSLRALSRQLREGRLEVRVFLRHKLHAKLYLCHRDDPASPIIGFVGSSNLTFSGLKHQGELNVDVVEQDAALKLAGWFTDRWTDKFAIDVSDELADIIDESWAAETPRDPYLVYLKMAYHLSQEARAGLTEFTVPPEFADDILDFQEKALGIAARHLDRRGGVIIGDVVGLGKTMVGSALAKVYQEDFGSDTLILCPPNLQEMWQGYVDRFRLLAKVVPLSMASTVLPELRRYRVVLIDESHNLRNREGKTYAVVRDYIEANGAKCILLSATPYNMAFEDLSSQLRLFIGEEQDLGIRPEKLLAEIGEAEFLKKADGRPTSIRAFEASRHADDWRDLMRLYMVRRTKTFIRQHYADTDEQGRQFLTFRNGELSYFPDRVAIKVQPKILSDDDQYALLFSDGVVDEINSLLLPRYGMAKYISGDENLSAAEDAIVEGLSRAGTRLVGFTRTGLFKRLESSGAVFLKSVERHIVRNLMFLHAIENGLEVPVGPQPANLFQGDDKAPEELLDSDIEAGDVAASELSLEALMEEAASRYNALAEANSSQVRWLRSDLLSGQFAKDLMVDSQSLLDLLNRFGAWDQAGDVKVNELVRILSDEHPNEKVVVFTEYADTAAYLGDALLKRGVTEFEVVTGANKKPTSAVCRFSPNSNKILGKPDGPELRVLVATDVLSEGQNLQDAAIVVSYDLPWAIIRLVQRAGRVDRIGQRAAEVRIYSFMPADGLESILSLRARLKQRLLENDEVVGSDEHFFDKDEEKQILEGVYDESSKLFDDDAKDVDLASFAYQIFTDAVAQDPSLEAVVANLPDVVYATKALKAGNGPGGVLVFTSTASGVDHLIRLDESSKIVSESPLAILQAAACGPSTEGLEHLDDHHKLVRAGVERAAEIGPVTPEGALSGVRKRIYLRLRAWSEEARNTLMYPPELEPALGAIYGHPLREHAKDVIVRNIKAGKEDADLAAICVQLHKEGNLVWVSGDMSDDELRIVCSMGLAQ
jgi:SNF2 family DNA or RNA helicase